MSCYLCNDFTEYSQDMEYICDECREIELENNGGILVLIKKIKRRKSKVTAGDYVIASRWSDMTPNDPWYVGFVENVDIVNKKLRYLLNGRRYRYAKNISKEEGFLIVKKYKGVDFEKINKDIVKTHENIGKTFIKGLGYGLMKFSFIWYYLIGWLMLFVLRDIVIRFNSAEIYKYFVLVLNIYSIGFIFVMIFLIGYFVKYVRDMIEMLTDDSWGIEP